MAGTNPATTIPKQRLHSRYSSYAIALHPLEFTRIGQVSGRSPSPSKWTDIEILPVICPTSQNVFAGKHPCQRPPSTLHGVVFDILVGSRVDLAAVASRRRGRTDARPMTPGSRKTSAGAVCHRRNRRSAAVAGATPSAAAADRSGTSRRRDAASGCRHRRARRSRRAAD